MTLLEECILSLGDACEMLDEESSNKILNQFQQLLPLTNWGRIDWNKISKKKNLQGLYEIENEFKEESCFIIWDEATLPVIKSNFSKIITELEEVLAVSFDTWILSCNKKFIVEFYHEGEMTIAYL